MKTLPIILSIAAVADVSASAIPSFLASNNGAQMKSAGDLQEFDESACGILIDEYEVCAENNVCPSFYEFEVCEVFDNFFSFGNFDIADLVQSYNEQCCAFCAAEAEAFMQCYLDLFLKAILPEISPPECFDLATPAVTCILEDEALLACSDCPPGDTLDDECPSIIISDSFPGCTDNTEACIYFADVLVPAFPTCCPQCAEVLTTFFQCAIPQVCPATPAPTPPPTIPAPAPAPVPAPALAPETCFSDTATVLVLNKGTVSMKDLKVNDNVYTGGMTGKGYEPVYAFGHMDNKAKAKFLRITTSNDQHSPLEITEAHLLYVDGKTHPVRADSIQVGDVLRGDDKAGFKVKLISTVDKTGVYTPLTPSGKLIVDGVHVSSYTALQDGSDGYFEIGEGNFRIAHSTLVHLYLAPFRMMCMGISSDLGQIYNDNGMPYYIAYGVDILTWAKAQRSLVQVVFLSLTLAVVLVFVAAEVIFGASLAPLVVLGALILRTKATKKNIPSTKKVHQL